MIAWWVWGAVSVAVVYVAVRLTIVLLRFARLLKHSRGGGRVAGGSAKARRRIRDLAQNLVTEQLNLADAKAQTGGPLGPGVTTGPVEPTVPDHLVDDAVNQHWRRSVGDPSAYGVSAAADDPAVQLVSQKMTNPRPREPIANQPVGLRHLDD